MLFRKTRVFESVPTYSSGIVSFYLTIIPDSTYTLNSSLLNFLIGVLEINQLNTHNGKNLLSYGNVFLIHSAFNIHPLLYVFI